VRYRSKFEAVLDGFCFMEFLEHRAYFGKKRLYESPLGGISLGEREGVVWGGWDIEITFL